MDGEVHTHTHTHIHTHAVSLSHTLSHARTLSLSHTHTLSLSRQMGGPWVPEPGGQVPSLGADFVDENVPGEEDDPSDEFAR